MSKNVDPKFPPYSIQNIVLLRGLGRESGHWGSFPTELKAIVEEEFQRSLNILTVDLPGTGRFWNEDLSARSSDWIEHLESQLGKLEGSTALVAVSLGGMIAVEWGIQRPHRFTKAILINTSFRELSPFFHRLRPNSYIPLIKAMCKPPKQQELAILELVSNRSQEGSCWHEDWSTLRKTRPIRTSTILKQLKIALSTTLPEKSPFQSTLILASAQDRLVSPACSLALAKNWSLDLKIHPTAGHDLVVDDSNWLSNRIIEFLTSV